jgi:hypothetical protein
MLKLTVSESPGLQDNVAECATGICVCTMPEPESAIANGEFVALLAMVTLPLMFPPECSCA